MLRYTDLPRLEHANQATLQTTASYEAHTQNHSAERNNA